MVKTAYGYLVLQQTCLYEIEYILHVSVNLKWIIVMLKILHTHTDRYYLSSVLC